MIKMDMKMGLIIRKCSMKRKKVIVKEFFYELENIVKYFLILGKILLNIIFDCTIVRGYLRHF